MLKRIRIAAVVVAMLPGALLAVEGNPPQVPGEGVIQALDFAGNTAVIGGVGYDVSLSAKVEIGGTFGAFTMLTNGLAVQFTYLQYDDGRREIIELREVSRVTGF